MNWTGGCLKRHVRTNTALASNRQRRNFKRLQLPNPSPVLSGATHCLSVNGFSGNKSIEQPVEPSVTKTQFSRPRTLDTKTRQPIQETVGQPKIDLGEPDAPVLSSTKCEPSLIGVSQQETNATPSKESPCTEQLKPPTNFTVQDSERNLLNRPDWLSLSYPRMSLTEAVRENRRTKIARRRKVKRICFDKHTSTERTIRENQHRHRFPTTDSTCMQSSPPRIVLNTPKHLNMQESLNLFSQESLDSFVPSSLPALLHANSDRNLKSTTRNMQAVLEDYANCQNPGADSPKYDNPILPYLTDLRHLESFDQLTDIQKSDLISVTPIVSGSKADHEMKRRNNSLRHDITTPSAVSLDWDPNLLAVGQRGMSANGMPSLPVKAPCIKSQTEPARHPRYPRSPSAFKYCKIMPDRTWKPSMIKTETASEDIRTEALSHSSSTSEDSFRFEDTPPKRRRVYMPRQKTISNCLTSAQLNKIDAAIPVRPLQISVWHHNLQNNTPNSGQSHAIEKTMSSSPVFDSNTKWVERILCGGNAPVSSALGFQYEPSLSEVGLQEYSSFPCSQFSSSPAENYWTGWKAKNLANAFGLRTPPKSDLRNQLGHSSTSLAETQRKTQTSEVQHDLEREVSSSDTYPESTNCEFHFDRTRPLVRVPFALSHPKYLSNEQQQPFLFKACH